MGPDAASPGPTEGLFTIPPSARRPKWTERDPKMGKQSHIAVSD